MRHLVKDAAEAPDVARSALLDDRLLASCCGVQLPVPGVLERLWAHVVHRADLYEMQRNKKMTEPFRRLSSAVTILGNN